MKNEQKTILKKVIDKFGIDNQIEQALEETIELALSIKKVMRYDDLESINHMAEEIADVSIMIEQLKLIFPDLNAKIEYMLDAKIDRLQYRELKN